MKQFYRVKKVILFKKIHTLNFQYFLKFVLLIKVFSYFISNLLIISKKANIPQNSKRGGNIRKWPLVLLLLLFLTSLYVQGQEDTIRFKHISLEDGLSQSAVYSILQDKRGFMWFATQDGLNRYDGYEFKIYKPDAHNISDNYIWYLWEDRTGIIWIGTLSGGLDRFDPETEEFTYYKHNPDNSKSLSHNEIRCILEDRDGFLWIGTDGGGLNRFDKKNQEFIHYKYEKGNPKTLSHDRVWCIDEDSDGYLWIGTYGGGLNKFDKKTKEFIHYKNKSVGNNNSSINCITSILVDESGKLWAGTEGEGLQEFDRKDEEFKIHKHDSNNKKRLSNNIVWSIYEDKDNGELWIGTKDGLNKFDRETESFTRYKHNASKSYSLSHNDIRSIYKDEGGVIWVGTYGGGLNKSYQGSACFELYSHDSSNPNSLSHNTVWSFAEASNGSIWIGTQEGLNKFDRKNRKIERFDELRNKDIRCIFVDKKDVLWIGTEGDGLYKFENGQFNNYKSNENFRANQIEAIYETKDGELWIGTDGGGLKRFDRKEGGFSQIKNILNRSRIRCIYEDRKEMMWIGTWDGGLVRLDRKNEKDPIQIYMKKDEEDRKTSSLSHNRVRCIHEDRDGFLWIGTDGGGLNKFDKKQKSFEAFQEKNGLPNNVVYGILDDKEGKLWLSTNKGLSRFDPRKKTFRNFDVDDGLQSNEFNTWAYFKSKTGEMFFGGINGFNSFFPENIEDDLYVPPVIITDFLLFNKPVLLQGKKEKSLLQKPIYATDVLKLSHQQDVFSFEFATPHFASPKKNRYKYKLEDRDKDWIETDSKNRRATYTNLHAGDYVFKVQGSNKDGKWNKKGTSIKIKVLPPPWKTWWAYTLYFLLGLTILFWFIRSQKKKVILLDNKVKKRTREIDQKNEALEKINIIVKAINKKSDLEKLLQAILEETMVIKGVEKASALVCDPGTSLFRVKASAGWEPKQSKQLKGIEMTLNEAEERYIKGSKSIVDDIYIAKNIKERAFKEKIEPLTTPQAMLVTRIRIKNTIEAYLVFDNIHDENAFDDQDILILKNLKEHIVTAFEKTRLINQLQESIIEKEKERKKSEEAHRLLIQAEKMASLGFLVAGVAHELNNPASTIMTNSEYFSRVSGDIIEILDRYDKSDKDIEIAGLPYQKAKEEITRLTKGLLNGSIRIKNIIDGLREFSRKEDSEDKQLVEINKIIKASLNLTENMIRKATNHFSHKLANDLPMIYGSFQKLEQVIINLIQNACQALPDNTCAIYISTNYDKKGNEIIVRIKDEGEGIEETDLKNITDPFFTTRRNEGGTGLGLSISCQIIENHGGTIDFESKPGKGTTVSVCLPVTHTEEGKK